jgi:glycosyltransferase involved in cell wall biosynthesis
MMKDPIKISATIITLNEEKKIERCLSSLAGIVDEILVVDSNSTDRTEEICRRFHARVIRNPFPGYVAQKNFAVEKASYHHILSLDADEMVSEELKSSILKVKDNWNDDYDGFAFNRRNFFCGKWIRFCGWYPDRKIRLWDRRKGRWGGTDPHDKVLIDKSKVSLLKGDLFHDAYQTIDEHLKQNYRFAEVAARAKYHEGVKPLFLVHVVFNPMFKFVKNYVLKLGFLDGYYGFVFCMATSLQNFYKYLRLYEYRRRGLPD